MKKLIWLVLLCQTQPLFAQIREVVDWKYQLNKLNHDEYEAVLTAAIEKGWHLYSKDLPPETGIPTKVEISTENIQPIGGITEVGEKISEFSEAFGAQIVYYSDSATFIQRFRLVNPESNANVRTQITFQACDDRICLAPNTLEFEQRITMDTIVDARTADTTAAGINYGNGMIRINTLDPDDPLTTKGIKQTTEDNSHAWVFVLGFLGGMIALLTPCVFPMIPLTVSFFTKSASDKRKGRKNALTYSFFILAIFLLLSLPFHLIDGISGNIFNELATSIWLNLFFFAVFIFFAISFFGYYTISLPSWLINRSSKAEEAGGMVGVFFMAFTLVIVSFSCTGPILGSLLGGVASTSKNIPLLLTFALGGFGLAWAFVFGALALFPHLLASLPRSGSWMNTLKVVLGFVELALALKFLSKADLVSKTFLLKRELFIGLWILIAIVLAFYLFGKLRFPYDSKNEKISLWRKIVASVMVFFALYMTQGLVPSAQPKLALLSGILPPLNVSFYASPEDGLFGIQPQYDYFEAVALAKKERKPVLLDFTGYGCENCRKMEEFVWSEPDILPLLQNEVILASLYVDDREELAPDQQQSIDIGKGRKKKIRTIGDKWSLFQQVNFNNNSQPHYVLVTPYGEVINSPVSGYMSKKEFKMFLIEGTAYFKENEGKVLALSKKSDG
ncbi:thiol:disulfide interchange protein DsbD [Parapedobacter luteus]|uniref:Thiol:disulfide interchange protein DsbD n=1 Tax=Parapedobacter luteus TaxID=623280 RepID=A0A1T5BHA3_9SPHI|nr:cytochrome c biogenesis protein CcdA [Parapedobacter luteus]SKB46628.1 thiol:disulfide interchange protein DsbD [Parapedobacter luteus]